MIGYSLSSESTPIILHSRVHSACLPLPKAALSAPPSSTRPRLLTRNRNQLHRLHAAFAPSNQRLQSDLDRFSSTSAAMALHEEQSTLGEESGLLKSTAEELNDESDFEKIVSPEGYISICGFGSLLSERSARSTFPDLINFRLARLRGFRRVFAHAAPVFFERGIAKPETKEISSLSVEPCDCETLIVTVFEIQKSEIPSFMKREPEFRFLAVFPETLDGKLHPNPSVLCARYSDEEFFHIRCKGDKDLYYQMYGKYNIHKIWRDDIFPCRTYLRHCVLAAKNLGEEALNNFLDHTYLGDRKTTIREYLATAGSGIMEEEPPESLKTRRLGVAVDFSVGSKKSLSWTIDNMVRKGDHLILVNVRPSKNYETGEMQLWESTGSPLIRLVDLLDPSVMKKYDINPDQDTLEMIKIAAEQKHIDVLMKIYWGDPREKLIEAIDNIPLNCLIMGSRGLGSLQRVLMGSVSNHVMNNATCPVTVVKHQG